MYNMYVCIYMQEKVVQLHDPSYRREILREARNIWQKMIDVNNKTVRMSDDGEIRALYCQPPLNAVVTCILYMHLRICAIHGMHNTIHGMHCTMLLLYLSWYHGVHLVSLVAGYLKVFQLSRPQIRGYDCILVDEAQDLTPG